MIKNVNLWVDGPREQVNNFIFWLHSQPCSIVSAKKKHGAIGMKHMVLELELHFKSDGENDND